MSTTHPMQKTESNSSQTDQIQLAVDKEAEDRKKDAFSSVEIDEGWIRMRDEEVALQAVKDAVRNSKKMLRTRCLNMKSEFFSALKKCTIEHSFRDGDNFVTERKLDPMLFAEKMSVDLEAPQFAGAFNDKSPAEKQFASIVMARLKQCAKYTAMTSEKFDGFDPSRKDHCKAALRRLCEAMEIGDSLMRIESFDGKEQLDHCLALFS